jgi:transcription antitermination factor NusG
MLCGTPAQSILFPWYCIKSEPSREQKAQRSLRQLGFETFLPEVPRHNSRFPNPLFPSYLFARFDHYEHIQDVKTAHGVSYVLGFSGQPCAVEDSIILTIKEGLQHYGEFRPGDAVRVTSGVFADLRGIFKRELSGTNRVMILLGAINFHGTVQIDRADILPANRIAEQVRA